MKDEIKLNYDPKLQIDDTWQKIRGKTRNLTRDNDRNDLINRRIQGFSFRDFENECRCARVEFSLIDRRNLSFNHFVEAEMCLEEIRRERFKDWRVYIDQFSEIIQECITNSKNILIYRRFGRNRPMGCFISDQRLWLIAIMRIVTIISQPLDLWSSVQMKPRDHAI